MKARVSLDHLMWLDNEAHFTNELRNVLNDAGIIVLPNDIDTDIKNWNNAHSDATFALLGFTDIMWDNGFMTDLNEIAKTFNNKIVLISDNIINGGSFQYDNLQFISVKEFYGVYYNNYRYEYRPSKLYDCLIQRVEEYRLLLFNELSKHNLLHEGYVSCLGYQIPDWLQQHNISTPTPLDVIKTVSENPGFDSSSIDINEMPFTNFDEPENLYDLLSKTKYSVINETYNSSNEYDNPFIVFTEKSIKSLQLPNISLILNSNNTSEQLLNSLNLKAHPLNYMLDLMPNRYSQIQLIIGILKNNITANNVDLDALAMHNQSVLKEYHSALYTKSFYDDIIKKITLY